MSGTNVEATKEPGEPAHAGNPGGASVWFRWTPSASGTAYFIVTPESEPPFQTLLAVYTGVSVDALTEVPVMEDAFDADKGTTYRIAVDGFDGATGTFELYWLLEVPPPNDNLADARRIRGASGRLETDNVFATREVGEPAHGSSSIWFRWTAPRTACFRFDTQSSGSWGEGIFTDTALAVYRGDDVAALRRVALNRDFVWKWNWQSLEWGRWSAVSFKAVKGRIYRIVIAGQPSEAEGPVDLRWAAGRIVLGDPQNNYLLGTQGSDYIDGGRSNDVISGLGGDDILVGGRGADVLHGGSGNDRLAGYVYSWPAEGPDLLDGGPGWDWARPDPRDRVLNSERVERL